MADISAKLVKKLRDITDAGMMDCKKALVAVEGDIDKAIEHLKEKGLSKAAKKADRVAAEGIINLEVAPDYTDGIMIEINTETDFVAKNDNFKDFVSTTAKVVKDNNLSSADALPACSIEGGDFNTYLKSQIAKIGENIVVRRIANLCVCECATGVVNGYLHSNARVGVLIRVSFNLEANREKVATLAKQLCMHIAAMKPSVLSYNDLDLSYVQKEKTAIKAELEKENEECKRLGKPLHKIPEYVSMLELDEATLESQRAKIVATLKEQKKPDNMIDKIADGQMARFKADSTALDQRLTLLGQFYVMDDKKTVAQVLDERGCELNDIIVVKEFIRYELGEGIEKASSNFADEVNAQLGS